MNTDLTDGNITRSDNFSNKMVSNIYLLHFLIEHLVFCEKDDALIVTKDGCNLKICTKFVEQSLQSNNLLISLLSQNGRKMKKMIILR